jgi:hypothetical protein
VNFKSFRGLISSDLEESGRDGTKRIPGSLVYSVLATVFVCLGFPAFFLGIVPKSLYQLAENRIDPYVYAAYIHDYARTLERFGTTYYSARIAYILPEQVLVSLLGIEAGYYSFRLIALSAATFSVYAIARRFYGLATAVFAGSWVCFTPWLPRSLLWTHYDGAAVVYVLMASALLLVPSTRKYIAHAAAGTVFALAVNCNLLLVAVGAAFLPGWLLFHRNHGANWIARAGLCLLGGFVLSYIVLILALDLEFPGNGLRANIVTLLTAFSLLAGGSKHWSLPLSELLAHPLTLSTIVLLTPATLVSVQIYRVGKRLLSAHMVRDQAGSFEAAALLSLALTGVLALLLHFFFTHPWLAHYYNNVYFFPASALVLISLAGNIERRDSFACNLYGAGIAIIVFWSLLSFFSLNVNGAGSWIAAACALMAIIGVCTFCFMTERRLWSMGVLALVLMISYLPIFANDYKMFDTPAECQREWDVYRGAVFLQRFINNQVPTSRSVGFWYSNSELLLYSIQSMFLWGYSRVAPADEGHPGMPVLDERTRAAIMKKQFLALLGISEAQTNDALAVIKKAELPFRFVDRTSYTGKTWGFHVVLLRAFPRPLGVPLFEVPLSRLLPAHGSQVADVANGTQLITGTQPYGYHLLGPLRVEAEPSAGRAIVRVELKVEDGVVGIAVEDAMDTSKLFETSLRQTGEMETVDIEIPDLASAGRFIIRNYRTLPSTVTIRSIQVFRAK